MEYIKTGNTYVVRMDKGDELVASLLDLAKKEKIKFAAVSGIGATNDVDFGCFNTEIKQYKGINMKGDFEITSLVGNINTMDGESYIHLHINLADENGCVHGGHLKRANISVTGEIVITCVDTVIDRRFDGEVGTNLLKF